MLRGMAVVEARAGGERAGGDGMWGNSASGDRIGGSGLEGRWLQFGSVLLALRHLMPLGALRHHQSFRVIFPNMQTIHLLSFYLSFFFFFLSLCLLLAHLAAVAIPAPPVCTEAGIRCSQAPRLGKEEENFSSSSEEHRAHRGQSRDPSMALLQARTALNLQKQQNVP